MKFFLSIVLTFSFLGLGTTAAMRTSHFGATLLLISITVAQVVGFRHDWDALSSLVTRASLISAALASILLAVGHIYNFTTATWLARFICVGLVSITIFLPPVFDAIARFLARWRSISPGLSEAVVICRNALIPTIGDFWIGLRSAPRMRQHTFRGYLGIAFLATVALASRAPAVGTELLTAVYIRQFDIRDTERLGPASIRFFATIVGLLAVSLFALRKPVFGAS